MHSYAKRSTKAYPLDFLEFLSVMILASRSLPAWEKKSSNSRVVNRAANWVTNTVLLSLSSSGIGGEGDLPPLPLLLSLYLSWWWWIGGGGLLLRLLRVGLLERLLLVLLLLYSREGERRCLLSLLGDREERRYLLLLCRESERWCDDRWRESEREEWRCSECRELLYKKRQWVVYSIQAWIDWLTGVHRLCGLCEKGHVGLPVKWHQIKAPFKPNIINQLTLFSW